MKALFQPKFSLFSMLVLTVAFLIILGIVNLYYTRYLSQKSLPKVELCTDIKHWPPDSNSLEIGEYDGNSLLSILEIVLTDPNSNATAIDIIYEDYKVRLSRHDYQFTLF